MPFNCRGFAENSYVNLFDGSIIKAKSLEEECKFFCVSWLRLEVYLWGFTFFTSHFSARTSVRFLFVICQSLSAIYVKNNVLFCVLLGFQEMDRPEIPCPCPHIHCLRMAYTSYFRTILKDNLLAYQCIIWLYLSFQWRDFPEKFVLESTNFQKTESRICWDCFMFILILHTLQIMWLNSF